MSLVITSCQKFLLNVSLSLLNFCKYCNSYYDIFCCSAFLKERILILSFWHEFSLLIIFVWILLCESSHVISCMWIFLWKCSCMVLFVQILFCGYSCVIPFIWILLWECSCVIPLVWILLYGCSHVIPFMWILLWECSRVIPLMWILLWEWIYLLACSAFSSTSRHA